MDVAQNGKEGLHRQFAGARKAMVSKARSVAGCEGKKSKKVAEPKKASGLHARGLKAKGLKARGLKARGIRARGGSVRII